ncbi:MAG TPA: cysteine synthase family protein [Firmicutes bacterium]|nr:cysteine synthase family protein [Bacillota bacterium]
MLCLESRVYDSVQEMIGHTPMVRVHGFGLPEGVEIYAKLEFMNPGGSVKDRIGLEMLAAAEREGRLRPGGTVIEPTAGNTGIGIALAAVGRGYRLIFVVPEKFAMEKQELMRALGGEIVHTPTSAGMAGAIRRAYELAAEIPGAVVLQQFRNPANPLAHFKTTGPEIYQQLGGRLDVFVAGVGSGGTFTGCSLYLKARIPHLKAVAVEPEGSILRGGPAGSHETEGIGVEFIPDTLDTSLIDEVVTVPDARAFQMVRELAQRCGLLVGSSSGAAFWAAWQVAQRCVHPTRIAVIFPDSSERYLSKGIYRKFSQNGEPKG